jgi:cell division protein FtsN
MGVALLAGVAGWALPASAQVGLGAERYEVTITPPKRPGTEAPVDAEAGQAETAAPAGPAASMPPTDPDNVLGAAPAAPPVAPRSSATAPAPSAVAADPSSARPATNAPLRTLQVGAFRQKQSAADLRDGLSSNFQDVQVVEVQSGGEPLYRVIVGRQPRGPALDDLKRRLTAAGHPAFEVPAPPASAAH